MAVDDELWDSPPAGVADDLFSGTRSPFDVDLVVVDIVLFQKTFGRTTIGAPES